MAIGYREKKLLYEIKQYSQINIGKSVKMVYLVFVLYCVKNVMYIYVCLWNCRYVYIFFNKTAECS